MARNRVKGVEETRRLLRKLRNIDQRIGEKAEVSALRKGANLVAREARALVAKRSGRLRKAIRVRKASKRQRAKVGGKVIVGILQPDGRHGHLVEFGTGPRYQKTTGRFSGAMPAQPFMRPALQKKGPAAAQAIAEGLALAIEKAAVKLSGSFRTSGLARSRRRIKKKRYKFVRRMR